MMKLLVAVVALLVAPACAEEDHTGDFEKLDDRIDHITARIHDLVSKIDTRVDPARIKRAHSLEERVVRLEGR